MCYIYYIFISINDQKECSVFMFESFSQGRYIWCHHPNGVKNALIRIWFLKVKGFCDLLNLALPVSKK